MTFKLKAYIYLIFVAMIWGFAAPIIKYTLQEFTPGVFLVYRFFLSSIIALIYLTATRTHKRKIVKGNFPKILLFSLLATTISLGALFLGLERTTVLDTNILTSVMPLLIVIAGAVYFKEKVTKREKVGVTVALLGTSIAVVLPVLGGQESGMQLSGNLLILLHIIADITALLIAKGLLRKGVPGNFLANIMFVVGFITITPLVIHGASVNQIIQEIFTIPTQYHLGVWYMAIISGTIAYALRNKAQKSIEVGEVGVFGYLNPIFSTPLAVLWLGEKINIYFIFGATLILTGIIISESNKQIIRR